MLGDMTFWGCDPPSSDDARISIDVYDDGEIDSVEYGLAVPARPNLRLVQAEPVSGNLARAFC